MTSGMTSETSYEVLSPWAEADPVPLRGLSARPADLDGRTIGLFSNGKRAAALILQACETQLRERLPGLRTSWYTATRANTPEALTEHRAKFETWVAGTDAVLLAAGD